MKYKNNLKMGILFGIAGFILTLLFGYLTTGTFDWKFPAVIGIGFFGGGFLGISLKELQQTGNQKRVNLIVFIIICFAVITQIYSLATGQIQGSIWRMILTGTTIIGCVYIGYFIISSLTKKLKK